MNEHLESILAHPAEVALPESPIPQPVEHQPQAVPAVEPALATPAPSPTAEAETKPTADSVPEPVSSTAEDEGHWHARTGRKGARRVHQLIQLGHLYEQEHGLKRGRQRLRQLIELGKAYEREHGLRPGTSPKRGSRLSRSERDDLLATLLHCLVRIARPSFRAELGRLIDVLDREHNGHAA